MKFFTLLITIFFLFLHPFTSFSDAPPFLEKMMVEGIGEVTESNLAAARKNAVKDGKENALREVLNVLLHEEVLERNNDELEKLVVLKSDSYIQGYKVMVEYLDVVENKYRIIIEFSLFVGDLKEYLANRGLLFKGKAIQQIVVVIDETRIGETFDYTNVWANSSISEEVIKSKMQEAGFTVLSREDIQQTVTQNLLFQAFNGNLKAVSTIGIHSNAEVVIVGTSSLKVNFMREAREREKSLKISIVLQVIRSDNGQILADLHEIAYVQEGDRQHDTGREGLIKTAEKVADIVIENIRE